MLVRIVKLTLKEVHLEDFKALSKSIHHKILATEGCQHLEMYQDIHSPNIFFTYSHWNNETSLNNYRNSPLFNSIWPKVKTWFDDKPQAWSVNQF